MTDGWTIDTMSKVLVVSDDEATIEAVGHALGAAGMDVAQAGTGKAGLESARSLGPDIMVLDLALPDMDGLEVCKRMHRDARTERIPVVVVSAQSAEMERVLAFELGADDFIPKPFSPRELALRVRRSIARTPVPAIAGDILAFGDLAIDVPGHRVLVKGRGVDVTATEFRLLTILAKRRGRVQTREHLLQDAWTPDDREAIDARTVDTHIRRLREKLGDASAHVETVRGVGYRFAS